MNEEMQAKLEARDRVMQDGESATEAAKAKAMEEYAVVDATRRAEIMKKYYPEVASTFGVTAMTNREDVRTVYMRECEATRKLGR